jgi:hypothetical protein
VRRRVAWLAHCRWALTGCGDANSVRDVLRGDGSGSLRFGQLPDRVAAGIDRLFGPPSSATPGGPRTGLFRGACGFSEIDWAGLAARSNGSNSLGLIAYFKHRRFVGYSYGPPYGGPSAPPVRDGLMLATGKGLGPRRAARPCPAAVRAGIRRDQPGTRDASGRRAHTARGDRFSSNIDEDRSHTRGAREHPPRPTTGSRAAQHGARLAPVTCI